MESRSNSGGTEKQYNSHRQSPDSGADSGLRTRLLDVLNLSQNTMDAEIIETVRNIITGVEAPEKQVAAALSHGLFTESEREAFVAMARGNSAAFKAYCATRREAMCGEVRG